MSLSPSLPYSRISISSTTFSRDPPGEPSESSAIRLTRTHAGFFPWEKPRTSHGSVFFLGDLLHHSWNYSLESQHRESCRLGVGGTELLEESICRQPRGSPPGEGRTTIARKELCSGMPLFAACQFRFTDDRSSGARFKSTIVCPHHDGLCDFLHHEHLHSQGSSGVGDYRPAQGR